VRYRRDTGNIQTGTSPKYTPWEGYYTCTLALAASINVHSYQCRCLLSVYSRRLFIGVSLSLPAPITTRSKIDPSPIQTSLYIMHLSSPQLPISMFMHMHVGVYLCIVLIIHVPINPFMYMHVDVHVYWSNHELSRPVPAPPIRK